MKLPIVKEELVSSVDQLVFRGDGKEWYAKQLEVIQTENPVLWGWILRMMVSAYVQGIPTTIVEATGVGLYQLLRAQAEVDELESE
jgi:hypothetical protein